MKKLICALLCAIVLFLSVPSAAFADSRYSTVSTTGVALVYPSASQYLSTPLKATVKASRANGSIYFMPMPKSGNGNLGTVGNGTEVTILAETNSYYFFETADGRSGWNGKSYFNVLGSAGSAGSGSSYSGNSGSSGGSTRRSSAGSTVSTTGVALVYPTAGQYLDQPILATVKASRANGSIYLMPMPKSGNGNLGTVKNGSTVTILAKKGDYYFFQTEDGRVGWNGSRFLTITGPASSNTNTGSDNFYDVFPDGEYFGRLNSWSDECMLVEMLQYAGRYQQSFNYDLRSTGEYALLDISRADVWLEYAWFPEIGEVYCSSIDSALATWIFDGSCQLWEASTMQIWFAVCRGQVTDIMFLYAA